MWPMLMPLIGAAGSIWGSNQNLTGARETNSTNLQLAREGNAFNSAEAQKNRDFQASQTGAQMAFQGEMANTVHQREMADFRKAGVNPLMAASAGGSPAPSGASAGGAQATANVPTMQNPNVAYQSLFANALEAAKAAGSIEQQTVQTDLLRTQIEGGKAGTAKTQAETDLTKSQKNKADVEGGLWGWAKSLFNKTQQFGQAITTGKAKPPKSKEKKVWDDNDPVFKFFMRKD
ncbi:MAG: DNA pilot protein [Microvirus sp.]|nr:MAG: DNA pilot protein [Microvirus sp.]